MNQTRWTIRTADIDNGPGYWKHLKVDVMDGGVVVGSYIRNYSCLYDTFCPFVLDGRDYALISDEYTRSAVIELPGCNVVAEEPAHPHGFCPTGFHVPDIELDGVRKRVDFALVCGCVWGDDSAWKVQVLDLSRIHEGILTRSAPFGYAWLPDSMSVRDLGTAIHIDPEQYRGRDHIPFAELKIEDMLERDDEDGEAS